MSVSSLPGALDEVDDVEQEVREIEGSCYAEDKGGSGHVV